MAGARRPLPTGWKELRSEHGFPFYTHEAKGVVQWEHPLDQAASSWTRRFTAAGHTYYYNPVIAETRWGDGSEWVRSADDRGLPVFFNLLTRETTCTEPPEYQDATEDASSSAAMDEYTADEYTTDAESDRSLSSPVAEELEEEGDGEVPRPAQGADSEDEYEGALDIARNVFGKVFGGPRWTQALAGLEQHVAHAIAHAAEYGEEAITQWVEEAERATGPDQVAQAGERAGSADGDAGGSEAQAQAGDGEGTPRPSSREGKSPKSEGEGEGEGDSASQERPGAGATPTQASLEATTSPPAR